MTRDLPVLDAVVTYLDEAPRGTRPQLMDIAEATGRDVDDVIKAADSLDGVYLDITKTLGPPGMWWVNSVTPEARVATGQWPSAQTMAARIIAGLEEAADREPDEVKSSRLREAASVLGDTVRDLSTNVLAAVITKQLGLG